MTDALSSPTPIVLTMGEPAGIGPDIAIAAFAQRDVHALPPLVMIACPELLSRRAAQLGLSVDLAVTSLPEAADADWNVEIASLTATSLPVVPLTDCLDDVVAGTPSARTGLQVVSSIERAVVAVTSGVARAMVTNPIAKDVLYETGFAFPGHTEFLGALASRLTNAQSRRPVMMLACDELRVIPATIHIPLAEVPRALTPQLLRETIETVDIALRSDFGCASPRITLTGLNPHAGESGAIGLEEMEVISPVVETLRAEGYDLTGPLPGDTCFHAEARARSDAVIAMYHDQALIPIKTLAFDRGVNVTLGLPFVRTSPDHGTAFGIAGTGQANSRSLIEAVLMADAIAASRRANA
ncbi:MAG: 4-hydroxythreonine-4-phosphate dehydrogenase PdxA [Pseudomonadota bacterium]